MPQPNGLSRNRPVNCKTKCWRASASCGPAPILPLPRVLSSLKFHPVQTEAAIRFYINGRCAISGGAKAWVDLFPEGKIRERRLNELGGIENSLTRQAATQGISEGKHLNGTVKLIEAIEQRRLKGANHGLWLLIRACIIDQNLRWGAVRPRSQFFEGSQADL